MSKGVIGLKLNGRLGNQLMQYWFARAYALRHDCDLVFVLRPDAKCAEWTQPFLWDLLQDCGEHDQGLILPIRTDPDACDGMPALKDGEINVTLCGYWSYQKWMIYTREQARTWTRIKDRYLPHDDFIFTHLYHVRHKDFLGNSSMPVVSRESYKAAIKERGFDFDLFECFDEDTLGKRSHHPQHTFIWDFVRLTQARVIFRANSTFSWCAAALSDAMVFSPVVAGHKPGVPESCTFVQGNWPRLECRSNSEMNTDLRLLGEPA